MFTIATNGYDQIFQDCLDSHRNYAKKMGYKYIAFTKSPPNGISGTNSAWLKVALMLQALKQGYKSVFFIDADALIRSYTPAIESVLKTRRSMWSMSPSESKSRRELCLSMQSTLFRILSAQYSFSRIPSFASITIGNA